MADKRFSCPRGTSRLGIKRKGRSEGPSTSQNRGSPLSLVGPGASSPLVERHDRASAVINIRASG